MNDSNIYIIIVIIIIIISYHHIAVSWENERIVSEVIRNISVCLTGGLTGDTERVPTNML